MVKLEDKVMYFDLEIYDPVKDDVVNKKLSDYKWKFVVLFFYPADFTFVCPTELKDLNDKIKEFRSMEDVEVLVISIDTVFSHRGWIKEEHLLENFQLPMVADRTTVLSRYFGVLNEETGNAERWTFIIDPDGVLKAIEIHTEPLGRSSAELVRKLHALRFIKVNPGNACVASWNGENSPRLEPSIKIAGEVAENLK
jgi:alkyl hydroperoxide reductase subunit AhpC